MPADDPAKQLAREIANLRREVRGLARGSQARFRSLEFDGQSMTLPEVARTGIAAKADAAAARLDAAAATSAAQSAASKADDAEAAALEAVGIAADAGRIVYTTSEPEGNDSTLWIPPPDNIPRRWDGTDWVQIPDAGIAAAAQAAADAEEAADAARELAQQAQNAASAASGKADTALTTAQGKNTVTYATTIPDKTTNPGIRAGDIWYQTNTTGGGTIVGNWRWDGTDWKSAVFGDAVLSSLTVGKLVSGTLNAATVITVGDPTGDHVALDGTNGLVHYAADAIDGIPNEVSRFGRDLGGLNPTTGEQTYAVDGANGIAAFQGLYLNSWPTIAGLDLQAELNSRAKGMVSRSIPGAVVGGIVLEYGVLEHQFQAEGGRTYRVDVEMSATSTLNNGEVVVRVRATFDGSRPTTASTIIAERPFTIPVGTRVESKSFPVVIQRDPFQSAYVKLLLTVARGPGQGTGTISSANPGSYMHVYDEGHLVYASGTLANNGSTSGSSVPSEVLRTYEAAASWSATYQGDGTKRTDTTGIMQGYHETSGNWRSVIGWPDLTAMLAGNLSIVKVEAYLYAYTWHSPSGGTARIGTHSFTAAPATLDATGASVNRISATGWMRSSGRWVDISAFASELVSGSTRGIRLGLPATTDPLTFGHFAGATDATESRRPRLRITYYK